MKLFARMLAVMAFAVMSSVSYADAVYPYTSPTYNPNAISPSATLTTTGDYVFTVNGVGKAYFQLSGSPSGMTAEFDGTASREASPTWKQISVQPVGGGIGRFKSITATGTYMVNLSGWAQVRFHVAALSSGSVTVLASATPSGDGVIETVPAKRTTYSASILGLTPASSGTDIFTITGSATTTVRVKKIRCSGTTTAAATAAVQLVKRSTADTAGTSTAPAVVPHDSSDPAGTATVLAYTVNPTLGTAVGPVRTGLLTTNTVASSAFQSAPLEWLFGLDNDEEMILRGVGEVLAVNDNAVSLSSGAAINCSVEWTEE